jgi:nucleotide-binding universal stress UspA family protein
MNGFRHILVPTDFGASSALAGDAAAVIAHKFGATMTLLHVYEPPVAYDTGFHYPMPPISDFLSMLAKTLEDELDRLKAQCPSAQSTLEMGTPWERILTTAKECSADLIIMGTHGRRGLSRVLLGSVAEKIVRLSNIPVMTFRATAEKPR